MITTAIIHLATSVLSWVLALLPSWSLPDWVDSASSTLTNVLSGVGALNYLFPVGVLFLCVGVCFSAWLVAFGIRIGRIVASFLTAGGGSAA